jgi:hypothetical protein
MQKLFKLLVLWFVLAFNTGSPAHAYQIYQGPPSGKFSDTAVLVSPSGSAVSATNPMAIQTGDSPSMDAADHLRVSSPFGSFEDKRVDGIGATTWEDVASGVGATSAWNANESTVTLTVGTGAADYEYRQTRYISYVPGKSQLIKITFVMGAGVTNVAKRAGYFDDNDGLFFQQLGTINSICGRTSTSGSPVTTCTAQSAWNLDKMDGTGPSGITLDSSKAQLLVINYLWQGVGRVRYGFQIDGRTYYVHQTLNANIISLPFIATPSLPVRYEIRNIAASAGSTLKQICVSVESEGGYILPGKQFSGSNGITPIAVTTRRPILAIRLANTYNTKATRRIAKILHTSYHVATNDAFCETVQAHFPITVTGGSWISASTDSAVEVNVGLTAVTAATQHIIDTNFLTSGQGNTSGALDKDISSMNYYSYMQQNAASSGSQMFILYCTSFTGTSNVSGEINWVETN